MKTILDLIDLQPLLAFGLFLGLFLWVDIHDSVVILVGTTPWQTWDPPLEVPPSSSMFHLVSCPPIIFVMG